MKKIKLSAMLVATLFVAGNSFAYITYLGKSLPNQAGVQYDYLLDQWDYATLAPFYGAAKTDILTAFYSADPNGNGGNFKLAGRNTLGGFPLFWGASVRNGSTTTTEYKTPNGASDWKDTEYNSDTSLHIGSLFAGIGVSVFTRLHNINNEEAQNSNNGTNFTNKGDFYKNTRNTYNAFGLNVGQGSENLEFFWSVGVEYVAEGGTTQNKTAGVVTTNGDYDPAADFPERDTMRLRTTGRLPITSGSLLAGWRASVTTSSGSEEYKVGANKLSSKDYSLFSLEDLALYLTQIMPVSANSRFLINEELRFYFSNQAISGKAQNPATGDGGIIFSGGGIEKHEQKTSSWGLAVALPLIFQVSVTQGLFINAGWHPRLNIISNYTITNITTTSGVKAENKSSASSGYFGNGNIFGLGLTYNPSPKLRVHLNANNAGTADAGNLTFGADYLF